MNDIAQTPGIDCHKNRLDELRVYLETLNVDGYIVPHGDEYQSEFIAPYAERLAWLTNFTGSAGFSIILLDKAVLFVDGRYTLQAETEVDETLYAIRHVTNEPVGIWLRESLSNNQRLGFDPHLHTPAQIKSYRKECDKIGAKLVALSENPIDAVWQDRPSKPQALAIIHPLEIAGQSHEEKRTEIGRTLSKDGYDAFLLTAPDSLCWLLNIRGTDVDNTPLVLASALLFSDGKLILFIDPAKVSDDLCQHLGSDIRLAAVDELGVIIGEFDGVVRSIAVDNATVSHWVLDQLESAGVEVTQIEDPCALSKACKNETEVAGIRAAHVRDGAALTNFLAWLDHEAPNGKLTEVTAAEKLEQFRRESDLYRGPSFTTISGAGANGAIIHYHATEQTDTPIVGDMLYLVDSGGQYPDGTTDVTRTIAIGTPTSEQKRRFTQVLKGHISIATARFPEGTSGGQLDGFARAALWSDGLDYDHGTGHGVGAYLCVHEGPQRIGKAGSGPALKSGMVVSNEPGYYKTGEFGIRIENLIVVQKADKLSHAEKRFLNFETITLAPIELRLVDESLLTTDEKSWLNAYHVRVCETLSPLVAPETLPWLAQATRAL